MKPRWRETMPSWFSSHLTHTREPGGMQGEWGLDTMRLGQQTGAYRQRYNQLEPHTYGVCIFVSVRVSVCILMLTQTHMESASE